MTRFIVIQIGARMHYAVPALLARAGMLERFYTDIHAGDWPVRYGLGWMPKSLLPKPVTRLLGRRMPAEIPGHAVRSVPWRALLQRRNASCVERAMYQSLLHEGFGRANALYSLCNGDLPVAKAAKREGLFVVHEQVLNPDAGLILREERNLFPGVEQQDSLEEVASGIDRDLAQWDAADLILVPSQFVLNTASRMGADEQKLCLVPYGVGGQWFLRKPSPQPGRVLFVGTVGLRKGNHYLAAAARLLRERSLKSEFRIVGPVPEGLLQSKIFAGPTYLGQVPRSTVQEEFLNADVFVLPTISEGSALVHLEALACGVPVITTPNCGSVVRDGIDGFIVPIRDSQALAEKIELLVTDRDLRERMSRNARLRAREYTWDRYRERLLAALGRGSGDTRANGVQV